MKILILEDEVVIAESLFQLLSLLEYEPLEPVATPEMAISIINKERPDLAILDITLQKGRNGLEVAEYIDNSGIVLPYIILSAHSDAETVKKVKGHRPAAYLVKPFVRESLFVAIEMAVPQDGPYNKDAEEPHKQAGELFIKTGTRHEKIDLERILYLQAKGKYTELNTANGKRLVRMSLSSFISSFNGLPWLRVHRSYAVNPKLVTAITPDELYLDKIAVPVGRFFQPQVEAYFLRQERAR